MLQANPTFPGAPPRSLVGRSPSLERPGLVWDHPTSTRDWCIYLLLALTVVLNLLDGAFTLFSVGAGLAVETNPLMNELLLRGPVSFMLGKIAIVSLGILLLWRLRQLRMALVGSCAAFFVYAGIFVWHVHGLTI